MIFSSVFIAGSAVVDAARDTRMGGAGRIGERVSPDADDALAAGHFAGQVRCRVTDVGEGVFCGDGVLGSAGVQQVTSISMSAAFSAGQTKPPGRHSLVEVGGRAGQPWPPERRRSVHAQLGVDLRTPSGHHR
jgi:hypothetical protein